jgi:RHS repeat-associated protein
MNNPKFPARMLAHNPLRASIGLVVAFLLGATAASQAQTVPIPYTMNIEARDPCTMSISICGITNYFDGTNFFRSDVLQALPGSNILMEFLFTPYYTIDWATNVAVITFGELPECYGMSLEVGGPSATLAGRTVYLPSDGLTYNFWVSLTVEHYVGVVKFDACGNSLPLGGTSTANAWYEAGDHATGGMALPEPISWSIPSNVSGATITNTGPANARVVAGTNAGTITVRATGSNGCYVDGYLDVTSDGAPSCSSRGCRQTGLVFGEAHFQGDGINVEFSLGASANPRGAGSLTLRSESLYLGMYHPATLKFPWHRPDVMVMHDYDALTDQNYIRQIRAPQGLVDVQMGSPQNVSPYTLKFYAAADVGRMEGSFFTVASNAQPLVTWTIENPAGGSANQMWMTEQRPNEASKRYEYLCLYDYPDYDGKGWKLTYPGTNRIDICTFGYGWEGNCLETDAIEGPAQQTVSTNTRIYWRSPYGKRLLVEIEGSGNAARTNNYSYYTNGLLQELVRADGFWERFMYDDQGRATNVFSAFGNQGPTTDPTLCRLTVNEYSTNSVTGSGDDGKFNRASPRKTTEYLLNQPVSLRYHVSLPNESREIQCLSADALWNTSSNLVTVTRYYESGFFFGKPKSVQRPDGTMEFYAYSFEPYNLAGIYTTNIITSGQPGADITNIISGTKTITLTGPTGQLLSRTTVAFQDGSSDITNACEVYSDFDVYGRATKTTFLDGTTETVCYGCCGDLAVTNREGTVTLNTFDNLNRLLTTTTSGVTVSNVFDAAGNILAKQRIGSDNSLITLDQSAYDTAGNLTERIDAEGWHTVFSVSNAPSGGLIKTTVYLTNATTGPALIQTWNRDGTLASATGSATHGTRYEYGPTNGGQCRKEIKLEANGSDTSEYTIQFQDFFGRLWKTAFPDGAYSLALFNTNGQQIKSVDPDGVTSLYQYNGKAEREYTALSASRGDGIDFQSDRITRTVNFPTNNTHGDVQVSQTYLWATPGLDAASLASSVETSTDGLRTWSSAFGLTNRSVTVYAGNGVRYTTNTAPDGSVSLSGFLDGRLQWVVRKDSAGNQLSAVSFGYDGHGRQTAVVDARNGTNTILFDNLDRITSSITPAPGPGQAPQTNTTFFDALGRVCRTVLPDGTSLTNSYFDTGERQRISGSRQYPVDYTFDYAGRLKTMKTWQDFAGDQGAASTTWNYHSQRGYLTGKRYDDNTGPDYTYTPAGRRYTRTWARNITTTYTTNLFGDIARLAYSDGTPGVTNGFDRLGRIVAVSNGPNTIIRSFDLSGALQTESLNGVTVSNAYDSLLRRTNCALLDPQSSLLASTGFGYDPASRLQSVSAGSLSATYSYLANSPLVGQILFQQNGTTRMTTTKQHDFLNRLTGISSVPSASSALSFDYSYNTANQRTNITIGPDGSRWVYRYDSLGQVISCRKYWPDGTAVAGQQFEYTFDDIGNRKLTKAGGDAAGGNLREASYTNNLLNQITGRVVPGSNDVIGIAHASSSVTVNSQSPYRKGEYYRVEVSATNAPGVAWQPLTNQAVLGGATNKTTGNLLTPPRGQQFWYDSDGNLLSDGVWTNAWDAENRTISTETTAAVPAGAKAKQTWSYYADARWAERVIYSWTNSGWAPRATNRFAWDGVFLAAILDHSSSLVQTFLRGLDLSGSMDGAAGAGGVLALETATNSSHFYAFDGNGNVVALVSATNGEETARYDYGPFGEAIRATGPMTATNPLRFSGQFADPLTGRVKYLHREYDPPTGRWPSRDPIQEGGGMNLYDCVHNDLANGLDALGLKTYRLTGAFWLGTDLWTKQVWASRTSLCGCIGRKHLGDISLRYAWVDASSSVSVASAWPAVWSWINEHYPVSSGGWNRLTNPTSIGVGVAFEFTPNEIGKLCCDSFSWRQEKSTTFGWERDGPIVYGSVFADGPGGYDWQLPWPFIRHAEYRLQLRCDSRIIDVIRWSYTIEPLWSGSYTVTLNLP